MPDESRVPTNEEVKRALQEAVLKNYPNPERIGCPGSEVLKRIAQQQKPYEDPHWDHIQHCSPCYKEFLDFRREYKRRRSTIRRVSWVTALAALLIIGIVPVTFRHWRGHPSSGPVDVLHLEDATVDRGGTQKQVRHHLRRGKGEYEIYLPIGSDPGKYEIEIRRLLNGTVVKRLSGTGVINDGRTLLRFSCDLTDLAKGQYSIAYRSDGGEWRDPVVELS